MRVMCSEELDLYRKISPSNSYFLFENELIFRSLGQNYSFDWINEYKRHIKKKYTISKEPFARALGIKKSIPGHICDCSGGTGKDAVLLLSYGSSVTIFERNLAVFCLISDAYLRFISENLLASEQVLNIHFGELKKGFDVDHISALYFDPMYPEKKKKSAKARKEMELFKDLVGTDEDYEDRLNELRSIHPLVVLKRPSNAPADPKPSHSLTGKTTRYDVYKRI